MNISWKNFSLEEGKYFTDFFLMYKNVLPTCKLCDIDLKNEFY